MKVLHALLLLTAAAAVAAAPSDTRAPLQEDFGYVEVRPGAHMFYVNYHVDQADAWTNYPLIMWLQGGPGSSGVGYGNFEELGPYFINQSIRETAWTKKANVMFVDNPVGTGYSYVEDFSLLTTTNAQIADDLVTLLKEVFTLYTELTTMPFFVYAESYGGKMTVDFALALDQAIKNGEIQCNFQGVALGDSWISPMDSVNTWGPFLYHMGFVDAEGQANIDAAAAQTQAAVDAGNWLLATDEWSNTEGVVYVQANGVNFYNVLAKENVYFKLDSKKHQQDLSFMKPEIRRLYEHHVHRETRDALGDLMNGEYHTRWNIPANVVWDSQGGQVFNTLSEDFMKPVVSSVVQLLETTDIYVAVFTGDLDLICDTPGTYRWIENMVYDEKPMWDATRRQNFFVSSYSTKAGYVQNYNQFGVYTILRSGHMVPTDAPIEALEMIDMITANAAAFKQSLVAETAKEEVVAQEVAEEKSEEKQTVPEIKEPKIDAVESKVETVEKIVAETVEANPKVIEKIPIEKPTKVEAIEPKPKKIKNEMPLKEKVSAVKETIDVHNRMGQVHKSHLTPSGMNHAKRTAMDRKLHLKARSIGQ